jgi:hypothetical protein|nr:MAG TPA: DNA-directed RNA polymerase II subunit [Caudoviricetes sp.]
MTRKFIDYAHIGTCEVCGKSAPVVVVSSSLGPCSCAYCEECYGANLEPYSIVVAAVWTCGWEDMADWAKARIRKTLTKLGKTEEEMLADAKAEENSFIASMQNYEEYCSEQSIQEE